MLSMSRDTEMEDIGRRKLQKVHEDNTSSEVGSAYLENTAIHRI